MSLHVRTCNSIVKQPKLIKYYKNNFDQNKMCFNNFAGNDLDIDLWPWSWYGMSAHFYHKIKAKGQDLDHYPAKLLKRFRFVQNVFTFFYSTTCIMCDTSSLSDSTSARVLVPRILRNVVWLSSFVDLVASSTFVTLSMGLFIRKYTTASTATVTLSFVKICTKNGVLINDWFKKIHNFFVQR